MLVVDPKEIERFYKVLKEISPRGLPIAARDGLNNSAFATRTAWKKEGERSMVKGSPKLRRNWTFNGRNHRVVKARTRKSINQMVAVTGNKLGYMAKQERGFMKFRNKGLQIAEPEGRVTGSHTRTVKRAHFRKGGSMKLPPKNKRYKFRPGKLSSTGRRVTGARRGRVARGLGSGSSGSWAQYVAASLRAARKSGADHVFLDGGRTNRGIYDIRGGKLVLVWQMGFTSTRTKRNPMLSRTLKHLRQDFPIYHRQALEGQLRFHLKKQGFRVRGANIMSEVARFRALG